MIKLLTTLIPPRLQLTAGNHPYLNLKYLAIGIILLATLGLADASYLTFEHFFGNGVRCFIVDGCSVVTSSSYSLIGGVFPMALGGLGYYLLVFILSVLAFQLQTKPLWQGLVLVSAVGVLASIYLTYIQAFVLEAYCIYCLFSAGFSVAIFIISVIGLKLKNLSVKAN